MASSVSLISHARSGATVVTASRRLSRALVQSYSVEQRSCGLEAWLSPYILPLDALLKRWWREAGDAILLSAAQQRRVWERVIADSAEGARLLQQARTADAARQAWALMHEWRLPADGPEWESTEEATAFSKWARAYQELCAREGWVDEICLPGRLLPLIEARLVQLPAAALFAGFEEFTPQHKALIEALCAAGCRCELHDLPHAPAAPPAPAFRLPLSDSAAEITAAAWWARALLERGEIAIGVIAPDLTAQRARVERIFESVLHPAGLAENPSARSFNLSAGPALADYPLVRSAFLVLQLGAGSLSLNDAGSLLRSPHLAGGSDEAGARALIDYDLRRRGDPHVSLAALGDRTGMTPAFAQAFSAWRREFKQAPRAQTPSGWTTTFSRWLRAMGWPGDRKLDSRGRQTLAAWNNLLSEFARLDLCCGEFRFGAALGELRRMAKEQMFQPESAAAPVQILGLLEASGLGFDHLWVMGLSEDAWPKPPRPNPFIPLALQRAVGLPHSSPERELEFAKQTTARLLGSARKSAIVSHPAREADQDLRPSPLIAHLPTMDAAGLPSAGKTYLDCLREAARLEYAPLESPRPLPAGAQVRGGAGLFQKQAACPFWAFAAFRLAAQALESGQFGLTAADRGKLVHSALEVVWRELRTHANLCACSPDKLSALIEAAAAEAIHRQSAQRAQTFTHRFTRIEQLRLERLVASWLDLEKTRAPFTVVAPERDRQAEFGGIGFTVRLDRVDRLDDGREVIVDYKTGSPKPSQWDGDRPDEPQLPLYSLIHDNYLAGVLFAQVKTGDLKFSGQVRDASIAPGAQTLSDQEWADRLQAWSQALAALASDFRAGRAETDPKKPETCRRCGLTALCRGRELGQLCPEPEENGND